MGEGGRGGEEGVGWRRQELRVRGQKERVGRREKEREWPPNVQGKFTPMHRANCQFQ